MGPSSFFGVTFCHVAPPARLRGGMDVEPEAVQAGKLHLLSSGEWYVRCKWCETEARLPRCDEEEAYGMLDEWRLPMPTDTAEAAGTTDTAETAGQPFHAAALFVRRLEVGGPAPEGGCR